MSASSRVRIGKVWVDRISSAELLRRIAAALRTRTPTTILNANAFAITTAERDPSFAGALQQADIVFCDGFGVYLASRLLGSPVVERITYGDWTERLAEVCRDEHAPMFLLGAREGVADEAARRLEARFPGLKVHSHHGYFSKDDASSAQVIDAINRSGATVLLVGFGMPLQEIWIMRNRGRLEPPLVFSVGAAIDYAAGAVTRGPRWLTQYGFEWLARLAIEPRRLWRRYLIGLPEFALLVLRQQLSGRRHVASESR